MSTSTKMVLVLTIVAVLAGGILSSWEGFTGPMIEENKRLEQLKAVVTVLFGRDANPDDVDIEEHKVRLTNHKNKEVEYQLFVGKKKGEEKPVGIAFMTNGNGFQGNVGIMMGVEMNFKKIKGITVLDQVETPGLGTKIVSDPSNKSNPTWFPDQFQGRSIEKPITVVKNMKPSNDSEIQAITGATISSRSVVKILNNYVNIVKPVVEKEGLIVAQEESPAAEGKEEANSLIDQAKKAAGDLQGGL